MRLEALKPTLILILFEMHEFKTSAKKSLYFNKFLFERVLV